MTISRKATITFYDADTLACAEYEALTLVTENGELAHAGSSSVDTVSLEGP